MQRPDRDVGTELRRPRPVAARPSRPSEPPVHRAAGDPRRLLLGRLLHGRRVPARAHARRGRALVERAQPDHRAERGRPDPERARSPAPAARRARRGDDRPQGRLLARVVGASDKRLVLAAVPPPPRGRHGADLPAGRLVRSLLRLAPAVVRGDRRPCPEPDPDGPVVARGGDRDLPRRRRPLRRRDGDPRPRARLLRPLPQGRRQRLGRAAAGGALRARRQRVARRARVAAPRHRVHAVAPAERRRSLSRAATYRRACRPLRLRPGEPGADDRRRQLGADDDPGRRDARSSRPARPAAARGARRRPRLHERAARPRPRGRRPGRDGVVRGVQRAGHGLHRPPLRRVPRRPLDLPHGGDVARALPQLERGRLDGAPRAERGRRVPDPLLPGGQRVQGRPPGAARRDELELPALLAQPEHRRGRRDGDARSRSRGRPCCTPTRTRRTWCCR